MPLSIEVFPGNTSDTKTFASQVHKVAERFGGGEVTFVGDRGMIKGPQIQLLKEHEDNFHYISALTKPQIEGLLKKGILQMSLFDEAIAEVLSEEGGEVGRSSCEESLLSCFSAEVPISTNEGFDYKHLYFIALHDFQVASF